LIFPFWFYSFGKKQRSIFCFIGSIPVITTTLIFKRKENKMKTYQLFADGKLWAEDSLIEICSEKNKSSRLFFKIRNKRKSLKLKRL